MPREICKKDGANNRRKQGCDNLEDLNDRKSGVAFTSGKHVFCESGRRIEHAAGSACRKRTSCNEDDDVWAQCANSIAYNIDAEARNHDFLASESI